MINEARVLVEFETDHPADVVLSHPHDRSLIVVGTYALNELTRQRTGSVSIYRLIETHTGHKDYASELVTRAECDAVLDIKWFRDHLY